MPPAEHVRQGAEPAAALRALQVGRGPLAAPRRRIDLDADFQVCPVTAPRLLHKIKIWYRMLDWLCYVWGKQSEYLASKQHEMSNTKNESIQLSQISIILPLYLSFGLQAKKEMTSSHFRAVDWRQGLLRSRV